jgi:hypothetical protein
MTDKKLYCNVIAVTTTCAISLNCICQVFHWVDNTSGMPFTIDVPQSCPLIRGIYFMCFSGEYDSGDVIDNWDSYDEVRDMCRYNRIAFLGAKISSCEIREVYNEAMDYFANASFHPELRDAPLIFDGVSAGVDFATCFSYTQFPEKTIAYIAQCGWGDFQGAENDDVLKIPALWITGGLNADGLLPVVQELFYENRSKGALWTLAIIPGMGHGRVDNELLFPYMDTLLNMRVNLGSNRLREIPGNGNWLGNNMNHFYAPYETYNFPADSASWLPSLSFASAWQEHIGGYPLIAADINSDNTPLFFVTYDNGNSTLCITNNYLSTEYNFLCLDIAGRTIFKFSELVMNHQYVELNTYSLRKGVYFIRIMSGVYTQTFPIAVY